MGKSLSQQCEQRWQQGLNETMHNIFQGNKAIRAKISEVLGYQDSDSWNAAAARNNMYFTSFFYLTKRFGLPAVGDAYKDAGIWLFRVKQYEIMVRISSVDVSFIVFGRIGHESISSPYRVKRQREYERKRDLLVELYSDEKTEKEQEIMDRLFEETCREHGLADTLEPEQYDDSFRRKFWDKLEQHNSNVLGLDREAIVGKYGHEYSNAYTRHALRTLEQFLKNMLTPIWVRDMPYNIKGRLSDEQAWSFAPYADFNANVKLVECNQE